MRLPLPDGPAAGGQGRSNRRNRLFPQVTMYRYVGVSTALSLGLTYVLKVPRNHLGAVIVLMHIVLYAVFILSTRHIVVVDEKMARAARARRSMIVPTIAVGIMVIPAVLLALIVLVNQDLDVQFAMSLMMSILLLCALLWRAGKQARTDPSG